MARDTVDIPRETQSLSADICVIGAGPGGLALASAAAAFGQRVILIEKHKMGGDGLNYGGVPANALLAAGRRAQAIRTASVFGVRAAEPLIDHAAVSQSIADVVARIAPNVSVERLAGMGIRVISAAAKFIDRSTVAAGEYRISARRFVIATGSTPAIPKISGLDDVPFFTTETIFDNKAPIPHLLVIGAGATGLELAQAYLRLGSRITVVDEGHALSDEDPEMAAILLTRLAEEGIAFREGTRIRRVSGTVGRIFVEFEGKGGKESQILEASAILIAGGRKANIADLNLAAAGVKLDGSSVRVNGALRTSNKRIFAIGDAAGGARYAHTACEHANAVLRHILFRLPTKPKTAVAPHVIFTEPSLARVGLSEREAQAKHGRVDVLRWPYHENDRAQIERKTEGHIKVVTTKRGRILGASIVGAEACEIIPMWSLAISAGLNIKAMTEWIAPYPTFAEISKKAAFRYFATMPSNPFVRKVIALLANLG